MSLEEATFLDYLTTEGPRFANTRAAFLKDLQQGLEGDGSDSMQMLVSGKGSKKAKAWICDVLFDGIDSGILLWVKYIVSTPVDVKSLTKTVIVEFGNVLEVDNDCPPLRRAVQCNQLAMVELFVESGHNIEAQDARGRTPFLVACRLGLTEVAEYLYDHGSYIDDRDHNGWTGLHWAAYAGHIEIAELLFRLGANLHASSNNPQLNEQPIDVAKRRSGHDFVAAILAEETRRRNGEENMVEEEDT